MIGKQQFVYCVLFALLGSENNAQEYVSRKISYEPANNHQPVMVGVGNEAQRTLVSRLTGDIGRTLSLESVQEGAFLMTPVTRLTTVLTNEHSCCDQRM